MNHNRDFLQLATRLMKWTLIQWLLIAFTFGVGWANPGSAQELMERRITLSADGQPMRTVFRTLEEQTGTRFMYRQQLLSSDRRVHLRVTNERLGDVLDKLLKPLSLQYELLGKRILITRQTPESATNSTPNAETPAETLDQSINGKVTDENGNGMPGVSIVLKGTQRGTTSNTEGNYSIAVPNGNAILVFSFVGYLSQEVVVGNQSAVNVRLAVDNKSLSEVVVVGYGTQKKADITGATSTLGTKDFNAGVLNNPLQAAQGRIAGLVITAPNGDPTQNRPSIRLRGISSLSANAEPLIVIDGVIGASLNTVAPEDIEKFDVLKDASASAIYGSRGANGVIIITTKRGKAGRTEVSYNGFVGFDSPSRLPDFLSPDEYADRLRQIGQPSNSTVRTNWFDEITRTAVVQNHNIGVSGGTSSFNYRASLTYLNQPGIALDSKLDRLNGRFNMSQKALKDRLEIQLNLSANTVNKDFVNYVAFAAASRFSPLDPVFNPDGTYFQRQGGIEIENPVARIRQNPSEANEKYYLGNIRVTYEVAKGLKLGVNGALSNFNSLGGSFTPKAFAGLGNLRSRGNRNTSEVRDQLIEYTATYDRSFDKHRLGVVAGYTYQYFSNEGFGATTYDFPDQFGYNKLQAANTPIVSTDLYSFKTEAKIDGILGRFNYAYDGRYLLTANIRRDGSSRFGENNRYGIFPSVSAGWRISQEPFIQGVKWLSDLKLRAGYGVTGNQDGISDNATQLLYNTSGKYLETTSGLYKTAYAFSQNANPDLKWESSAMTNVGLDFGLFNNRLMGSVEFYTKNTNNVLFNYPIAIGTKYGSQNITAVTGSLLANVGSINNKGIELNLDYLVMDTKELVWRTSLNLARNVNKVTSLSNDLFTFPGEGIRYGLVNNGTGGFGQYAVLKEGYSVGTFFGPQFAGLNEQGQLTYFKKDGTVTNDQGQAELRVIGNPQPKLNLGISNNFTFKGFDLGFLLRGAFGQDVFNSSSMIYAYPKTFPSTNVLGSTFEGENAKITNNSPAFSSRYIEKASFLRLDNATLGYTVPVKAIGLNSLRVYVAGQNLFVLTGYSGMDPEVRSGSVRGVYDNNFSPDQNLSFGADDTIFYPRTRSISAGVQVSF